MITSPLVKGMNKLFVELSQFLLYLILPLKMLVFQSIARRPKSSTLENPVMNKKVLMNMKPLHMKALLKVSYPCCLTEHGIFFKKSLHA